VHPTANTFGVAAVAGAGATFFPARLNSTAAAHALERARAGMPAPLNVLNRCVFEVSAARSHQRNVSLPSCLAALASRIPTHRGSAHADRPRLPSVPPPTFARALLPAPQLAPRAPPASLAGGALYAVSEDDEEADCQPRQQQQHPADEPATCPACCRPACCGAANWAAQSVAAAGCAQHYDCATPPPSTSASASLAPARGAALASGSSADGCSSCGSAHGFLNGASSSAASWAASPAASRPTSAPQSRKSLDCAVAPERRGRQVRGQRRWGRRDQTTGIRSRSLALAPSERALQHARPPPRLHPTPPALPR
jgi:hypothetical protein